MRCPSCSNELPEESRFCGNCGTAVDLASSPTRTSLGDSRDAAPTSTSVPGPTGAAPPIRAPSFGVPASDGARFLPGAMVAGRYRINGLIGRGGMGEVYRADDLKLGQPVALKFLPAAVSNRPDRLSRFLNEVKIARQVSHPNVCRVYDIGEFEGHHYLSMEFVDGEDLATLLQRVGHVPGDRALQMARQLCAGLAAAHELGVLHRDIKPANVMLDGRGRVKLTDFGLAGLIGGFEGTEVRAGTPVYMAPEQIAGEEVSVRSDIYSLGLVLYELFTGQVPFEPDRSLTTLPHVDSTPTSPSSFMEGFDPAIERAIMPCLETDPQERPPTALAVSATLPGSDALAAALAAGETPSPEMVAAAGGAGALRPGVAAACLIFTLASFLPIAALHDRQGLAQVVGLPYSAGVLAEKSREILRDIGYESGADRAYGFERRDEIIRRVMSRYPTEQWAALARARPSPIRFWYRESPNALLPERFATTGWTLLDDNPARIQPGMTGVRLVPDGRLGFFYAVPPTWEETNPSAPEPDWSMLFDYAKIDVDSLEPATPMVNLPFTRNPVAWEGAAIDRPDEKLRIEAGSFNGRPVMFSVLPVWFLEEQIEAQGNDDHGVPIVFAVMIFVVVASSIIMARRNLRSGRGDRRGATRLAWVLVMAYMAWWLLRAHYAPDLSWFAVFALSLSWALFNGGLIWVIYVALEPHVRRLWPEALVSWTRLLAGRVRDPRVGRDVLIGGVAYGALTLWQLGTRALPEWLELPVDLPVALNFGGLVGARQAASQYFGELTTALTTPMLLMTVLVLFRLMLRSEKLTILVVVAIFSLFGLMQPVPVLGLLGVLGTVLTLTLTLVRFGVLALSSMLVLSTMDQAFVLTLDFNAWYAGQSIFSMLIFAGVLIYAFRLSVGGRSLFSETIPSELSR